MKKVAFHGSLRRGFGNHTRFNIGEMIGESTVRGAMFLFYSYPHLYLEGVCEPEKYRDHKVEIYELDDETYSMIEGMEIGAGYQVVNKTLTDTEGDSHDVVVFYSQNDHGYHEEWIEEYTLEVINKAYVG